MKPQKAQHKYLADMLKTVKYLGQKYLMFPKVDGWYGYIDIGQKVGIKSNAGRLIPSCKGLSNYLTNMENELPKGRLIFEITVDGTPQFETLNGILNRKVNCKEVRLNVHDFIPEGQLGMPVFERYTMATHIVELIEKPWIEMIGHLGVSDNPEYWESLATQLIDKGHEGWIGKHLTAPYQPGVRNHTLLKIKEECTFDLLVVGMHKGKPDSKYANTLGVLIVMDSKGNRFPVSGMTDKQRTDWFNTPSLIMQKVVEVKAKNVMKDGSLREGRFKAQRFNKNSNEIDEVK